MLSSLSDLPLDEAGRLASHWLLLPEGCVDSPGGLKGVPERLDLRNIGVAAGDLADALQLTDMCPAAVALEQVKSKRRRKVSSSSPPPPPLFFLLNVGLSTPPP